VNIVVAGGTGFLGRALVAHLAARGHQIAVLTRSPRPAGARPNGVRDVSWTPAPAADETGGSREVDGADAIINLAGAGIADKRWSAAHKQYIRDSRVFSTRSLVAAVRASGRRPAVFIQGSAVGFYGSTMADTVVDESFPPGDDFLGQTCVAWEAEAHPVSALGCRLVIVRTGIALAADGGPLIEMKRPFLFFVGGPIGSGQQYFSWVHRDDWIALVAWLLDKGSADGVYNGSAPEPVTNAEFSNALGQALRRPSWLRVPRAALRIAVGEVADVLVAGQRVVPARALSEGFIFMYPRIDTALTQQVGRGRG
jgi:hypothetical protein